MYIGKEARKREEMMSHDKYPTTISASIIIAAK